MKNQEIVTVLEELNKISGFRISLHDKDYREIAAYPESMNRFCYLVNSDEREHLECVECDRKACLIAEKSQETYIYTCRFGLVEAVSPLYHFGILTGFLMMGQVVKDEEDKKIAAAALKKLSLSKGNFAEAVEDITVVNSDMIPSYVRIMTICAEYLTAKNAVTTGKSSVPERAKKYIEEHISEKFGITDICEALDCSKSTLLTSFKRTFGVTVNTYITERRLRRAAELLSDNKRSISEISSICGFSDQSYFSKVFSKEYGIPPSMYKDFKINEN